MSRPVESCDVEIRVRYAETDAMGFLHHAQYFVYFEIGRTELLRLNGLRYRDMEDQGLYYVVARLDCRYKAPARYDDVLTLRTRTTRISPVRVDHNYVLTRAGQTLCEANSTLVLIDRAGQPTRMPDAWFAVLVGDADAGGPCQA